MSGNEEEEVKKIKHYRSSHKILLVGEGDFSFSACLATAFGSAENMVATSLDSKDEVAVKYSMAGRHLKKLKELGCSVIHGVDALTMNTHSRLGGDFDRIVFNFPHSGLPLQQENNLLQIKLHQDLVKGFLESAGKMVKKGGEVHVTHKTANSFRRWEIGKLGEEVGLRLVETAEFKRGEYHGYINKRGYGPKCNRTFRVGECSTFIFLNP